jgi:hypothetical protein
MDTTFLFLDESVDFNTAWLTGVFVPAEQCADVRDAVIRIARDVLIEAGNEYPHPTELHGADLLRSTSGITDEHRFWVFDKVVALVNQAQLEVISVGHSNADETRRNLQRTNMDAGDKLYCYNFYEMVHALQVPHQVLVQPVFAGVPRQQIGRKSHQPVDEFAHQAFLRGGFVTHWYRIAAEIKPVSWVHYKTNLRNFAEPVFSDAAQAPLLQLADVVGYLLGVVERTKRDPCSAWKTRVASIGSRLDRRLVHRRSINMHFQDVQQGASDSRARRG